MPAKKHTMKSKPSISRSAAKAAAKGRASGDSNANIRWIGLAVIVLVVVALAWSVFSSQPQAQKEGDMPKLTGTKQYASAPPMTIDPKKQYTANVVMEKGGEFIIQLHADKAPITVNSFVFLAREGYFDGVTFHRVLEGFMAQGGDPTGTGRGGPGYQFVNEDSDLVFDKAGVLAMANAGRDTNGSQFFITFAPQPRLNGGYTIFGQVTSGMDVVNGITRRNPEQSPSFTGDAIKSVTITEK